MTEGDTDLIDGYDDVDTESQEKIKKALEDGHVADAEWKGVRKTLPPRKVALFDPLLQDVECNRPGQKGHRLSQKARREVCTVYACSIEPR